MRLILFLNGVRQKYYSASEISCELAISKRKLWVVETTGGLLGSLTLAAAVTVETLLVKKRLIKSLMELSQSQLHIVL